MAAKVGMREINLWQDLSRDAGSLHSTMRCSGH
jgi:hypothetical protein